MNFPNKKKTAPILWENCMNLSFYNENMENDKSDKKCVHKGKLFLLPTIDDTGFYVA